MNLTKKYKVNIVTRTNHNNQSMNNTSFNKHSKAFS